MPNSGGDTQNTVLLQDIPFGFDSARIRGQMRIPEKGRLSDDFDELCKTALSIGRPRALFRAAYIETRGDDYVVADGVRLDSRVLRVNLASAHRIFPFGVTCGVELEQWARGMHDPLYQYWADAIKEKAMRAALAAMKDHISRRVHSGKMATMTPGSIDDWPMDQQQSLIQLMGDGLGRIGVYVTGGMMMVPTHSLAGIRFPAEESFESCQLCPRKDCAGRRAPYDVRLYDRRYK
ncbi:MAG: hypothetical protein JEZ11_00510 [Desulfobacterales bacterium]|nr:hypothetical protein [Desulfobacterales bacterium]